MRLIDTDALIEALDSFILDDVTDVHGDTVREILERLPTIERKTGKWIRGDAEKLTGSQRCSICHKACYKGKDYFNYCPNCGADMRGGNER